MGKKRVKPAFTSSDIIDAIAAQDRTVRVHVSPEVLYDLDSITQVLHRTLGQLGCDACCSGHDIRFETHRDFVVDSKLNVRPA